MLQGEASFAYLTVESKCAYNLVNCTHVLNRSVNCIPLLSLFTLHASEAAVHYIVIGHVCGCGCAFVGLLPR